MTLGVGRTAEDLAEIIESQGHEGIKIIQHAVTRASDKGHRTIVADGDVVELQSLSGLNRNRPATENGVAFDRGQAGDVDAAVVQDRAAAQRGAAEGERAVDLDGTGI